MSVKRWTRSVGSYLPAGIASGGRRAVDAMPTARFRPHRPDDLAVRDFRRPNPVLVHAGVEISASVASLRRQLGQCQVHAFEANERLHDELRRADVTVHGALLAAHPGTVDLFVPRYGGTSFDSDASLDHTTAAMFLGEANFANYQPDRAEVETLISSAATLDSFDLAPDIVVLDQTRGADAALHGATETLARHRPLIRIAGDATTAVKAVESMGYVPARYDTGAAAFVLEQSGDEITWLVHPHHRGLIATPVV